MPLNITSWPLLGLKEGIEQFNEQLIAGDPSLASRPVPRPVRMPLPPAGHQGSIYETQRGHPPPLLHDPKRGSRIAAE